MLVCYNDIGWAEDIETRRYTSGYLVTFVRVVSLQSKCVALSTTKVEHIAVTEASKEMLRMKWFLKEQGQT